MKLGNAIMLGAAIAIIGIYIGKKMNERRESPTERFLKHPAVKIGAGLVSTAGSVWFAHFLAK